MKKQKFTLDLDRQSVLYFELSELTFPQIGALVDDLSQTVCRDNRLPAALEAMSEFRSGHYGDNDFLKKLLMEIMQQKDNSSKLTVGLVEDGFFDLVTPKEEITVRIEIPDYQIKTTDVIIHPQGMFLQETQGKEIQKMEKLVETVEKYDKKAQVCYIGWTTPHYVSFKSFFFTILK